VGYTKSVEFDVAFAKDTEQRKARTGYDLRPS
jgi:hypothetical protein